MNRIDPAWQASYDRDVRDALMYSEPPHPGGLIFELYNEVVRAASLHPPMHSGHEGYATILEELDELWEVVKAHDTSLARGPLARKEALQIAAMGLRYIIDVCREEANGGG